ncbi:MAG: DUF4136 domain-containing protein [Burkholderiales bacterium]|nr:DUF4136 domain-containing protein [Burkholderiales bacterium]
MRRRAYVAWVLVCCISLLTACAAPTIKSEVTVFHEWPADVAQKTFTFERSKDQDNNLEYRSYENLVRAELLRLGFREADVTAKPGLHVNLGYAVEERDVRVVEPVAINPGWAPPMYAPRWTPYGFYDPFFANPFWYGPPIMQYRDVSYRLYKRRLHIVIARVGDGKKLYDVTVNSEGQNPSLAAVMPYMVRSAFAEFPGKSGVARRVELPFQE